jgi:hypothetical protein
MRDDATSIGSCTSYLGKRVEGCVSDANTTRLAGFATIVGKGITATPRKPLLIEGRVKVWGSSAP